MLKLATVLLILGTLMLTPIGKNVVSGIRLSQVSEEKANLNAQEIKIPLLSDLLSVPETKVTTVKTTLTVESKNTYVFRGPVTGGSVGKAISEISKMSRNLGKTDIIYLVLDTPGGSVFDGLDFIDFIEGLPQEVKTVTLFAASMGFQIVENNPGKRLIVRNGTLMSHRASLGGLEGQLDGEFETRYKMIKRKVDYLETVDAKRMGITLDEYKKKIKDELWIHGFDAISEKVADEMILLQCGSTMTGEEEMVFQTFFGPVTVVFDKCPLIRDPIRIEFGNVKEDARSYVKAVFNDVFLNKSKFVKDIIVTEKFYKIFP